MVRHSVSDLIFCFQPENTWLVYIIRSFLKAVTVYSTSALTPVQISEKKGDEVFRRVNLSIAMLITADIMKNI